MRLWILLGVLVLATGLGLLISHDPGYALFAYNNWTLEMPLWTAIIVLIVIIIVSSCILWLINTIFSSSSKIQFWWGKHKQNNARLLTYKGLLELTEGHWEKAERLLSKGARFSDTPLINYLSAAKAAEELDSPERRDRYLELAFEASAGSDVAVRLTQAQLQMKHGDLQRSIANLEKLHQEAPKHPKVLRLLCTLYEAMDDYKSLFPLLPSLYKTQAFPKEILERLEQKSYQALLPIHAEQGLAELMKFWRHAPRSVQNNPGLIYTYAELLMKNDEQDEAESLIRGSLKKNFQEDLIYLYGLANGQKPNKQLEFAESLLPNHFDNPMLLLTLGRICLRNQLWNKAREYLEQSLAIKPSAEAYAEIGQLMEQLGQKEKSEAYYKKGLLSMTRLEKSQQKLYLSHQQQP